MRIVGIVYIPVLRFRSITNAKRSRMKSILSISLQDGTMTVMYLANVTLACSSCVAVQSRFDFLCIPYIIFLLPYLFLCAWKIIVCGYLTFPISFMFLKLSLFNYISDFIFKNILPDLRHHRIHIMDIVLCRQRNSDGFVGFEQMPQVRTIVVLTRRTRTIFF